MKQRFTILLFFTVLSFAFQPAHAKTVEQLLKNCEAGKNNNSFQSGECMGYIDSSFDVVSGLQNARTAKSFCLKTRSISGQQLMDIFMKWAKNNPELYHVLGYDGVRLSLVKAFPCK